MFGGSVRKRMMGTERGTGENFREVEFLLWNRYVSGQNPLGSKYQDEKERLGLLGSDELVELLQLRCDSVFDGLGRLGLQWNIRWF